MSLREKIKNIYIEQSGEDFIHKKDCIVTLVWHNPVGIPIIRLMQKLHLKIHPNVLTILALPFGLLAGYCFFINELVYGAIFFAINMLIDSFDGKWARIIHKSSPFGKKLDNHIDRVVKAAMYFGIWYSQFYQIHQWLLGAVLIIIHYIGEGFRNICIKDKNFMYKTIFPRVFSYYSPFEESYLTFFFAPLLGMIYILLPVAITLTIVTYLVLFIKQKERPDIKQNIRNIIKI